MKNRCGVAALTLIVSLAAGDARAQSGVVRGKVVDGDGKPAAGARVVLEYLGGLVPQEYVGQRKDASREVQTETDDVIEGLGRSQDEAGTGRDADRQYQTETDDEGRYSLIVAPGRYQITVSRENDQSVSVEHSVDPRSQTRVPDLRLVSLKSARTAAVEAHEVLGPLKRAMELTQAGRLEEAEIAYKEVLARDPSVIEARYNLAIIYLDRKDYAAAEGELQKMVELSPETAVAYPALSRVYAEQGESERALEVMARGAALVPDDATMQFNLGVLYYNAQRAKEAEDALRRAEALDPDNVRIQFMLGNLALHRSDLEEAAARFEKYLAAAPEDAPNRGTAEKLLEQLQPALSPEP